MTMSEIQILFERAIHHHLSYALFSNLEKINEFQIGTVLVYHKKPHFWRRNELDFSSLPLCKLILEEDASNLAEVETYPHVLFSTTDDHSDMKVNINVDVDADAKVAFLNLGSQLGGSAKKNIYMEVSLGGFKHITSNMYDVLSTDKPLRVNPHHPIVQDALAKGKCFFVITSVYQSDKVEIKINNKVDLGVNQGIQAHTNATSNESDVTTNEVVENVAGIVENAVQTFITEISGKIEESVDVGSNSTSFLVTKRSIPTNIAFQVMKVDIGRNGALVPRGKSGFDHHAKIHYPYGDTFVGFNQQCSSTCTQPLLGQPLTTMATPCSHDQSEMN